MRSNESCYTTELYSTGSDTDVASTLTINVIVEGDGINGQLDYDNENETNVNDTASEDNDSYNSSSPQYMEEIIQPFGYSTAREARISASEQALNMAARPMAVGRMRLRLPARVFLSAYMAATASSGVHGPG